MKDIYTPLAEAVAEIKKRWQNDELKSRVAESLNGDIPFFLQTQPHLVLFRHIISPNGETDRLLKMAKDTDMDIAGLEYTKDKFVAFNADKQTLVTPTIHLGERSNGQPRLFKINVANVNDAQGKPFDTLRTLWGQNLIDFHHSVLFEAHPEFKDKVFEFSDWLQRNGGRARLYYEHFMSLLICNCILAESFQDKVEEQKFMDEVFIPAFEKAESKFGVKPLIVKLAPNVDKLDDTWWYPKENIKDIMNKHILNQKEKHVPSSY